MNREIKFRAWHVLLEKMNYLNLKQQHDLNWFFFNNGNKCILLQYTGLKDKNGTEIYEGDICNITESIGIIEYCKENAQFIFTGHKESWNKDWTQRYLKTKIIGNIYENPELLEEGK